ncbi:NnrS family protein [Telluria mixta]|uniref:NnrS family protein n=1 Tax=Telluria mixta TaxID=34071 RepID=A0ABT2BZC4_9BURK|nr:NnrS family protein [Telluria mixta]MCS0630411.1 NnrS family protein [Telluria mixta]WEM94285.1 NnrS family protein [Telluria mixta]
MALMTIEEARPAQPPAGHGAPLFALGFRPFYLLAAAFGALAVPLWIAAQAGVRLPVRIDMLWHMHEMVFGFALAVVVGFLYTAGYNWTKLWTPRGKALAAIAAVWVAGRIAMLAAPPVIGAVVDAAFLPVAAWPLFRVLKQSGNMRNMFLVGLLALLTLTNVCYHAAALGWLRADPLAPVHAAILLIVVIEIVIGGRVIPMFTRNGAPGTLPVQDARRDTWALALTVLAGLAWTFGLPAPVTASLALFAAVGQAVRLLGWQPWRTWRNPLLWILHVSYFWIPFGFLLLALAQYGVVTGSAALHVLTVGALAGLIMGMITRTALGHTGRPLKAGRGETAMFVLVQAAVVLRFAAGVVPAWRDAGLVLATMCWTAAFLAYLAVYVPYLTSARIDGREG